MEFWNDIATDRSWKALIVMSKGFDFIVIGGWAAYLLTKTLKSKDIDIIVDFDTLAALKAKHRMSKNEKLKKYEIKVDGISVDIYVEHYSRFAMPVSEIKASSTAVEGIEIPSPEALLVLKQQAELSRSSSIKGQKDRVDILALLLKSGLNIQKYKEVLHKHNLPYLDRLKQIISSAKKEFHYLNITNPREAKKTKERLLKRLS